MSFTLVSVIIILLTLSAIISGVLKGHARGLYGALNRICRIFAATLLSLVLSLVLSDIIVDLIFRLIIDKVNVYISIKESLPSVENIAKAYTDAAITPLIFLVLFSVCYLLVNIVVGIIERARSKRMRRVMVYEGDDAPWYVRNSKPLGAIVGGISGLFLMSVIIASLMGTLQSLVDIVDTVNNNETVAKQVKVGETITEEMRKYSNDLPANVVYHCGGNLIYKMSATSTLNGKVFSIKKEIKGLDSAINDAVSVLPVFNDLNNVTDEQRESVVGLSDDIGNSETLKTISADFLSQASGNWLEGKKFMGMSMPNVGDVITPVVANILYVCKTTTPETAPEDIKTLLKVYLIISENNMVNSGNYEELIAHFSENDVIDEICSVVEENPRMKNIAKAVRNVTMNTVASAINVMKYDSAQYDMLMTNLANSINGLGDISDEEKVSIMTESAMQYISDYGVDMPESVAEITAQQLVNDLANENGNVTPQRLQILFDSYSVQGNG